MAPRVTIKACPSSDHCKTDWEGPFVVTGTTKDVEIHISVISQPTDDKTKRESSVETGIG